MSGLEGGRASALDERDVAERLQAWAQSMREGGASRVGIHMQWTASEDQARTYDVSIDFDHSGNELFAHGSGATPAEAAAKAFRAMNRRIEAASFDVSSETPGLLAGESL